MIKAGLAKNQTYNTDTNCQTQLKLQLQLKLELSLVLVPLDPATHQPTGKVSSSHFKGKVSKAKLFMMIS